MRLIATVLGCLVTACGSATGDVADAGPPPAPAAPDAGPARDAAEDAGRPSDAAPDARADALPDADAPPPWGHFGAACAPPAWTCDAPWTCLTGHTGREPWSSDLDDLYMRCVGECDTAAGKAACGSAGGRCETVTQVYAQPVPKSLCVPR